MMIYWTPEEQARLVEIIARDPDIVGHLLMDSFPGRSIKAVQKRAGPLRAEARAKGSPIVPPKDKRDCLRCKRPFTPFDKKKNWMCGKCD
jgi:hypothetical protein